MGAATLRSPHDYQAPLVGVIRICFFLSLLIHLSFAKFSDFLFILPGNSATPPIKISLADAPLPPNVDMPKGRIEGLAHTELQEKPDKADILARTDSKAHMPGNAEIYQAQQTILPTKKINPSHPAKEKSSRPRLAENPLHSESEVQAVENKPQTEKRHATTTEVDLFATARYTRSTEVERSARSELAPKQKVAQSQKLSTKITNQPALLAQERERMNRAEKHTDGRSETYMTSDTDGVLDVGDGEGLVSLNSQSFKYVDYFEAIKRAIDLVWAYPERAAVRGAAGVTVTLISLSPTGELLNVQMRRSSGFKALDDEAMLAVKTAAPYPPFPPSVKYKVLHVVGSFVYQNSYSSLR